MFTLIVLIKVPLGRTCNADKTKFKKRYQNIGRIDVDAVESAGCCFEKIDHPKMSAADSISSFSFLYVYAGSDLFDPLYLFDPLSVVRTLRKFDKFHRHFSVQRLKLSCSFPIHCELRLLHVTCVRMHTRVER